MTTQITINERVAAIEALMPVLLASAYDDKLLREMLDGWQAGRAERESVVLIPIIEPSISDLSIDRTIALLKSALAIRESDNPARDSRARMMRPAA